MMMRFADCLFTVEHRYVVPPENTTAVVITFRGDGANIYTSIEDLVDSSWTHRENSSRSYRTKQRALADSEVRWRQLQNKNREP